MEKEMGAFIVLLLIGGFVLSSVTGALAVTGKTKEEVIRKIIYLLATGFIWLNIWCFFIALILLGYLPK